MIKDYIRAVDAHMELAKFWSSDFGMDYGMQYFDFTLSEAAGGRVNPATIKDATRSWVTAERNAVCSSDTTYVTSDMTSLIETAGASMPAEAIMASDMPSPEGFVYFDRPFVCKHKSVIGEMQYHAFSWWVDPANPERVMAIMYVDREWMLESDKATMVTSREEFPTERWRAAMPRLIIQNAYIFTIGETPLYKQAELGPYIKALWTISQQRIATTTVVTLDRATTRRVQRSPIASSDFRVVTLRRRVGQSEESGNTDIEWSHRWLVSGHWRNQYLPSRKDHRLQWIPEYIKGPDDKPLIVKPTVYRVAR